MAETLHLQNPDQVTEQAAGPSRLGRAMGKIGEGVRWAAPVVGTALKEETGVDPYRFAAEQPELNHDQQFATGVTRWAIRRAAEHMTERRAAA